MTSKLFLTATFLAALLSGRLTAQINCKPTISVHYGFVVNIHPVDNDGDQLTDADAALVRVRDLIIRADDVCNSYLPLKFGLRKTGTGTGMPADTVLRFGCDELGAQSIEVWVRDAGGHSNYTGTFVIVQANSAVECEGSTTGISTACAPDVLAPEILAFNGLSGCLHAVGTLPPFMRVPATALVKAVYDNCGGAFQYRIRKSGQGFGVPAASSVSFDCSETGVQPVEVWVGDAQGNWAYVESYILVQDVDDQCTVPKPVPTGCANDKMPPELLAYSGIATELATNLKARVYAADFIRTGADKCQTYLQWRITKVEAGVFPGVKPPLSAIGYVDFDCSNPGNQNVYIWLGDKAGNWAKVEASAAVLGSFGGCGIYGINGSDNGASPNLARMTGRNASGSAETISALSLAPNPVVDGFTLSGRMNRESQLCISIFDCLGREAAVLQDWTTVNAGAFQYQFTERRLPPGLYYCVLHTDRENVILPLIFQ